MATTRRWRPTSRSCSSPTPPARSSTCRTFQLLHACVSRRRLRFSVEVEVPGSVPAGAWTLKVDRERHRRQTGWTLEVAIQDCYLTLERDTFGEGEIKAMIKLDGRSRGSRSGPVRGREGYKASDITA